MVLVVGEWSTFIWKIRHFCAIRRPMAHEDMSPDAHRPPRRSSVNGHIATVFGCTGFLGRYVVSKLAKQGTHVVIPYRDEDSHIHLKLTGDLGQITPLEFDLKDRQTLVECVRHSDIVYNLIGRNYETK
ncbi:hypothetical protein BC936DRAFT_142665 [Jimgerdemannia flammicorona]|uniref:NmrA-like domain-containing protein n=1 Tax=Jimgerdemannia flammicorona TaxID=994334 RepID=A0A433A0B6_9FUNG|nr:hypothetical protein BC936DRAFT_142665 [Jimgerdemannia flammicorona]